MQLLGLCHGKLSPAFVARTVTGFAILEDPLHDLFQPLDIELLRKVSKHNDSKGKLYLSPEAYNCAVSQFRSGTGYNLIKSDVFSFGLILLEAAVLIDTQDIY